jgi:hypothetical protein
MIDARRNAALNGVRLPDGREVSWADAFPTPEWSDTEHWAAARPEEAA